MTSRKMALLTPLAALAVLAAAPAHARADQVGPLVFQVPEGYRLVSSVRGGGGCDLRGPDDATISIRVGLSGGDAASVTRAVFPQGAGEEVKGVELQVAGVPGFLVVRRAANRIYAAAGCLASDGRGVAILLGAPPATYQTACAAWGGLVDGATLAAADEAPVARQPRRGQGPGDHREDVAPRRPARHWIELRNVADWGTATCYWDGEEHQLGPGEGQRLEVAAGVHAFRWQNTDGSWGEARYEVPRFSEFKASCPRPQEEAPAVATGEWSEEDLKEAARWYSNLTCLAFYFVHTMDQWPWKTEDIHAEERLAPLVAELRQREDLRAFCQQIPGAWERLKGTWASGSAEERYQLRREAALFIRRNSPESLPVPADDGVGGDEIDLILRTAQREWEQARARRQQARYVQASTNAMMENWIFNNTLGSLSFSPIRW